MFYEETHGPAYMTDVDFLKLSQRRLNNKSQENQKQKQNIVKNRTKSNHYDIKCLV